MQHKQSKPTHEEYKAAMAAFIDGQNPAYIISLLADYCDDKGDNSKSIEESKNWNTLAKALGQAEKTAVEVGLGGN